MFREMRRRRQQLPAEECEAILRKATHGVLALAGDNNYPYALPISYVYANGKIYIHSAVDGHKIDSLKRNNRLSMCVVDADDVQPEHFTTHFRSVIVFGTARFITDATEIHQALTLLARNYWPEGPQHDIDAEIDRFKHIAVIEITPDHITGKEAIELTRMRAQQ